MEGNTFLVLKKTKFKVNKSLEYNCLTNQTINEHQYHLGNQNCWNLIDSTEFSQGSHFQLLSGHILLEIHWHFKVKHSPNLIISLCSLSSQNDFPSVLFIFIYFSSINLFFNSFNWHSKIVHIYGVTYDISQRHCNTRTYFLLKF